MSGPVHLFVTLWQYELCRMWMPSYILILDQMQKRSLWGAAGTAGNRHARDHWQRGEGSFRSRCALAKRNYTGVFTSVQSRSTGMAPGKPNACLHSRIASSGGLHEYKSLHWLSTDCQSYVLIAGSCCSPSIDGSVAGMCCGLCSTGVCGRWSCTSAVPGVLISTTGWVCRN